jgi:hypothetical protein
MKPRKRVGNAENYLVPCDGAARPDWLSELRQLRDRRPIVTRVTVAVAETLYRVGEGASAGDAVSDADAALASRRLGPSRGPGFDSALVEVASARQKVVVL